MDTNGVRSLIPTDTGGARITTLPDPLTRGQESFAAVMARSSTRPGMAARSKEAQTRESAEQFVAITFVQPILKQLRESNSAAGPFAPSSGEKQFRALMDADIAQRVVKSSRWPLVDRVTQDLLKAAEKSKAAATRQEPAP
ncbi:MAG: hypothetical protein AABZ53_02995 [Planctomycetota bacterium]